MRVDPNSIDEPADDSEYQEFLDKAMQKVVSRRKHSQQVDEEAISEDLELLSKLRSRRNDIDLLRAVAEHGRKNRVTTIAPVMDILRGEQPGEVSHLVTEGILATYELVLGICVLVRWNRDTDMHNREDTDQIVKHAVVHTEDTNEIVAVIRERSTLQYDAIMSIVHAMRANPAAVLADGTL